VKQIPTSKVTAFVIALLVVAFFARTGFAESQDQNEYKGITDPFGDPSNYEFADDEKEDKEFFHLGRYFQVGFDLGAAIFTGGLGATTAPGFYAGARMIYFFDRSLAMEIAVHFSDHLDSIHPTSTTGADIDTQIIPVTLGLRYYFDTKDAPKAIALANPYLVGGIGAFFRIQTVLDNSLTGVSLTNTQNANFGAFAGGGLEFPIYKRHIYMGIDARYNYVIWNDQNQTYNGLLVPGARSGGYVTTAVTITYNF
jgi:outer membrane protein W